MYLSQDLSISKNNKVNNRYRNQEKVVRKIKSSLSHILSAGNKQSKKLSKLIAHLHGLILLKWIGWSPHIMWDTNFEAVESREILIFDIIFNHTHNKIYNGFSQGWIEIFYSFCYSPR